MFGLWGFGVLVGVGWVGRWVCGSWVVSCFMLCMCLVFVVYVFVFFRSR